jgi:hypothetical protein
MCDQLFTWPADQPRHATYASVTRSIPDRPRSKEQLVPSPSIIGCAPARTTPGTAVASTDGRVVDGLIIPDRDGVGSGCRAASRKIGDGSRRRRRGAHGRWQLLALPGIMRGAVWCVGPTATKQARRWNTAMTPSGVHLSVIVRVGNEGRRASPEGASGRNGH